MAENTKHRTPLPDGWCEHVRSARPKRDLAGAIWHGRYRPFASGGRRGAGGGGGKGPASHGSLRADRSESGGRPPLCAHPPHPHLRPPKTPSALLLQDLRASSIGASAGMMFLAHPPHQHRLEAEGREVC